MWRKNSSEQQQETAEELNALDAGQAAATPVSAHHRVRRRTAAAPAATARLPAARPLPVGVTSHRAAADPLSSLEPPSPAGNANAVGGIQTVWTRWS